MLTSLLTTVLVGIVLANKEATESSTDINPPTHQDSPYDDVKPRKRITLLGLDELLDQSSENNPRLNYEELHANDLVEDSFFDPFALDSSCLDDEEDSDCWQPPSSTVEEEFVEVLDNKRRSRLDTLAWGYGGDDPDDIRDSEEDAVDEATYAVGACTDDENNAEGITESQCKGKEEKAHGTSFSKEATSEKHQVLIDKHWGSDPNILRMRDRLRGTRSKYWDWIEEQEELILLANTTNSDSKYTNRTGKPSRPHRTKSTSNANKQSHRRPPVFLIPGLASTRLVSWKHKPCPQSALLSDIKMLDYVWLNMNMLIQMATIDVRCWSECMTLGKFQRDYDEEDEEWVNVTDANDRPSSRGCKLRPDEGLDAISSLAPGSISSSFLVGGTNTVYAWLIQWLADNLGYDVSSIVALPYDWRLSPDKMEERDGFLTMMRHKIEAAVKTNGLPGVVVAHSMGNAVFRYFQEWLRVQMREAAYERFIKEAEEATISRAAGDGVPPRGPFWRGKAWVRHHLPGGVSNIGLEHDQVFASEFEGHENDELKQKLNVDSTLASTNSIHAENVNRLDKSLKKFPELWELAKAQGDRDFIDWLGEHIWTYVGLAAPLLGAPGPLRSVLSGENMGLPFTDEEARVLELSFGSTQTVNPISTKMGFCDENVTITRGKSKGNKAQNKLNLACLDELVNGIESSRGKQDKEHDPWKNFPALRLLLKDRVDFDSGFPIIRVEREYCEENEKSPCHNQTTIDFGPADVMDGQIFDEFSRIWKEKNDPLRVKFDQLRQSWWQGPIPNPLMTTPERPHIKHVVMAYGCDVPTEAAYVYRKKEVSKNVEFNSTSSNTENFDGIPSMTHVIWEEKHGRLALESKISESSSFADALLRKKKPARQQLNISSDEPRLHQSGDGTIPYISLMWAHTWLLHATRAMQSSNQTAPMKEGERISNPNNALDSIKVSHRPKGGSDWLEGYGADPRTADDISYESRSNFGDTGTQHPHGTKYKPKMVRFQSSGKSRSTGMEYTTTVIEAIGVEHKETTRNYDILAAAFTDVLKNLHDDYGLV